MSERKKLILKQKLAKQNSQKELNNNEINEKKIINLKDIKNNYEEDDEDTITEIIINRKPKKQIKLEEENVKKITKKKKTKKTEKTTKKTTKKISQSKTSEKAEEKKIEIKQVEETTTTSTSSLPLPLNKRKKKQKTAVSQNWLALQSKIGTTNKRKREEDEDENKNKSNKRPKIPIRDSLPPINTDDKSVTKYLAVDCEMVGVGKEGKESMLARVVIVNYFGNTILDRYVAPVEKVVDYRTKVSGITPQLLLGAPPFKTVQKEVADIIKDKILIGHSIDYDLKALLLSHPYHLIRDTAKYAPLMRKIKDKKAKPHALRHLARTQLKVIIQSGEHDPAVDARTALLLYMKHKKEWEDFIEQKNSKSKRKFSNKKNNKSENKNNNNDEGDSDAEGDVSNNSNNFDNESNDEFEDEDSFLRG